MNIPIEIFLQITDSLSFTETLRMNRLNKQTTAAIKSKLEKYAITLLTDLPDSTTEKEINEAVKFLIVNGKRKEAFVLLQKALEHEAAILNETLAINNSEIFDATNAGLVLDASHSNNKNLQRYTCLKNTLCKFYGIAGLYGCGRSFSKHEEFTRLVANTAINYITKHNIKSESIELIKYWKMEQQKNNGNSQHMQEQWKDIILANSSDISFSAVYLSINNSKAFSPDSEINTVANNLAKELLEQSGIPVDKPLSHGILQDNGKEGFYLDDDETSETDDEDEDDYGSDLDDNNGSRMETDSDLDVNYGSDDEDAYNNNSMRT